MATAQPIDFVQLMPVVAVKLLGEPNKAQSSNGELRFRARGSLSVDRSKGTFYDHEAEEGGGCIEFIKRERRVDDGGAFRWLESEGLIPPRESGHRRQEQPRSTFYDYEREPGCVGYRVERIALPGGDHTFRQWGPDARGGFNSARGCMEGVEPLPYRLPDILCSDDETLVYICEGEKDADRLRSLGLIATTNSGGAGKWRPELSKWLVGRRCIILEDNDEAGRKHVAKVIESLEGVATSIGVVTFREMPPKSDVSDWLDAGGTRSHLEQMAEASFNKEEAEPDSRNLPLPVELFADIRPTLTQRFLIKGLLMASATTVVFGLPGCGKSFLALDQALHIAAGVDWFGRRVRSGRVVYIAAEGQAGLRIRVEAWKQERGYAGADLPFALIPTAVDLMDPEVDMAKLRTVLAWLADRWGGIELVIIDTLAATFGGGDENGSDMATYVANVASLCAPYDCARMIVTHAPLAENAKRPRGHSSLWGASDTVLHVTGDRDAPARVINVIKQKDGDPGPDITFALRSVPVGLDEDGENVTSCIVEESDVDVSSVRTGRRLSSTEQIVLKQLERMLVEQGRFPPSDIPDKVLNRASIGKVVAVSEWAAAAMSALHNPDKKPDSARRAFDRVKNNLQASDIIGIWEDWAWLV